MQARRILAFLAIAIITVVPFANSAPASAAEPGQFVSKINGLRASKGLAPLNVDGRLSGVAQDWANQMASAGKISHRPNLSGSVSGGWSKLGENVGTGGDVDSIFNALVNSSGHYRNMVDGSFDSVGVGIAVGADGRIYTAHNFAAFGGAPAAPAKAAPAPAPAKAAPAKAAPAPAPAKKAAAPKKAAPAPAPAPVAEAPAAPAPAPEPAPAPAPPKPVPAHRIVLGLAEVGSLATQG